MWATTKWEAALYREWSRRRKGTDAAERSGEVQLQAMWSEAAGDHQWLALTTPHAAHTKLGKHDASNEVRSAVAQQVYVLLLMPPFLEVPVRTCLDTQAPAQRTRATTTTTTRPQ